MSVGPSDAELAELARLTFEHAYAPYSKFRVGAALVAENGEVFTGVNVENASYGLTRCAEQSAIQAMVTAGHRRVLRIHIFTEAHLPASPCGACRQILYEFGPGAVVMSSNAFGEMRRWTVRELLPDAFGTSDLAP